MLATIASLIDRGLADVREHHAMLLKARSKPFVLDDATIADTKRVNGEGLEWCDVYDRQLERWRCERLTRAQQGEVARLQGVSGELRVELTRILELADELGRGTIERQLAKSDLELGLERLLENAPHTASSEPESTSENTNASSGRHHGRTAIELPVLRNGGARGLHQGAAIGAAV